MPFKDDFQVVTLIFGCFTEMPRHEAEAVLAGISNSLCPGERLFWTFSPRRSSLIWTACRNGGLAVISLPGASRNSC